MEGSITLTNAPSTSISYEHVPADIHTQVFNYLLKDLSDTEAIKAAKQLSLTCKTQYSLFLNPILQSFETYIFSNIENINKEQFSFFITTLPLEYYLLLMEKIQKEAALLVQKIDFIDNCTYIKKDIQEYLADYKNIIYQSKQKQEALKKMNDPSVKKMVNMIEASQNTINDLEKIVKESITKTLLLENNLKDIQLREQYRNDLSINNLYNNFYTQYTIKYNNNHPSADADDFTNWIEYITSAICIFCARKLLQTYFYTDFYYNAHHRLLDCKNANCIHKRDVLYNTDIVTEIEKKFLKTKNDIKNNVKLHFVNMIILHLAECSCSQCKKQLISPFKSAKELYNFPYYCPIDYENYSLSKNSFNLDSINFLYKQYKQSKKNDYMRETYFNCKNLLKSIPFHTKTCNHIQLTFYTTRSLQFKMRKFMQYMNKNNPAGTTVTIKTVNGINHFTEYNQRFLDCIQNNQYPNITFVFQVPQAKEDITKLFFNRKFLVTWYNIFYYINKDIGKEYSFFEGFQRDWFSASLVISFPFIIALLILYCPFQEYSANQKLPISLYSLYTYGILFTLRFLGFLGSKHTRFQNIFHLIPWHIIHPLLRDALLLYSVYYRIGSISSVVILCSLFELASIQKSLFYKPLIVAVYNLCRKKNPISIVPY